MTSGERGQTTSIVCCVSVSGRYIPPMVIFKRKRMADVLKIGAPPGSLVTNNDSGWMDHDGFFTWIQHFHSNVQSSKDHPVLVILDGHTSHTKNIQAIEFARENGIHMISLPPYTTHRLQPLDRSFFGPLNSNYNQAADKWMRNHAGQGITSYQICTLFGEAYTKTATMSNALAGFEKCGIWPCNRDIFCDDDYIVSDQFGDPDDGSASATDAVIACVVANRVDAGTQANVVTAEDEHNGVASGDVACADGEQSRAVALTMSLVNLHVLRHHMIATVTTCTTE